MILTNSFSRVPTALFLLLGMGISVLSARDLDEPLQQLLVISIEPINPTPGIGVSMQHLLQYRERYKANLVNTSGIYDGSGTVPSGVTASISDQLIFQRSSDPNDKITFDLSEPYVHFQTDKASSFYPISFANNDDNWDIGMDDGEDFVIRNNGNAILELPNHEVNGGLLLHPASDSASAALTIYGYTQSLFYMRERDTGQRWYHLAGGGDLSIRPYGNDNASVLYRNNLNKYFFRIYMDNDGGSYLRIYDTDNAFALDKIMTVDTSGRFGYHATSSVNSWLNTWDIHSGVLSPVTGSSRVQIGSEPIPSDTTYKLSVDGKIIAKEIMVEATDWPDYVFDSSYKLQPISLLRDFISKNRHLPNIPTATEVAKNGIELGKIQAKLLEKIEELTLYTIDQEEQITQQEERLIEQQELLQKQQAQIDTLMKRLNHLEQQ